MVDPMHVLANCVKTMLKIIGKPDKVWTEKTSAYEIDVLKRVRFENGAKFRASPKTREVLNNIVARWRLPAAWDPPRKLFKGRFFLVH